MKRAFTLFALLLLLSFSVSAQSTMTDEQIMEYVLEQQDKGTSQSQIVTQLMQRGVTVDQIRRLRNKYEQQKNGGTLGVKDITGKSKYETSRARTGKSKTKSSDAVSPYRKKDGTVTNVTHTYNEEDADFMQMKKELDLFAPDSTLMMENELLARMKSKRKIFGHDIFNRKDVSFEPNMNIATPQNYKLGPGDAVFIDVWGASQNSFQQTVSPDGTVQIEGFGPIQLSGLTVAQANARLRYQLGSRYQSSKIRLTVGETRTIMVNVMGEVKTPGTYTLSAFATIFHALYMAGGINDIGTMRNIKVYRNNHLVTVVDVYDYILNGKLTGNVRLADNDVIIVGSYDCLVNVTGKVKRPMFYEMRSNESVGTAIGYAGGFTGDAYKKFVRIVRKGGHEHTVYNVGEFEVNNFQLMDEDSISVDSVLERYSNMVEVKGAVMRPGMYQVGGDINSVRTLIEHADGLSEDAFTAHAVMHRMKADRTLEVLSVDVGGIMSGKVADIPLRNEDVLYIVSKQDVQKNQDLTVYGEVVYPGVYQYADNETLEDLILQAGGLKDAASTVNVSVDRRIVDPKAMTSSNEIAKTFSFALKDGFVIDGEAGFKLRPYDVVTVRRSPGYFTQKNVIVEGEVLFDGKYTLSRKSERLSDMIKKAGGLSNMAYVKGARLERVITVEERLRMERVLKMAKMQSGEKDSVDINKLDLGNTYFVGIELDKALANPGGDDDIVLREGDRIIVPQYTGTVKVSGEVMYPNTVGYRQGKDLNYYIDQAGGFGSSARKRNAYIIYMNGTVAKVTKKVTPQPGCEIVVPAKPKHAGLSLAEILTIGTSTASVATMIATIATLLK